MEAIPEGFLRTVVFLCVDESTPRGTKRVPRATGFFVRVPLEGSKINSLDYVVTARHCIDEARQYGQIYIRENRVVGGYIEFPTLVDDWLLSDNADVAVIPLLRAALPAGVGVSDLEGASIALNSFVGPGPDYKCVVQTKFGKTEIQPRVGHQVYFLGLFTQHYGTERNLPIARFGHISRMPDLIDYELNDTRTSIVAYLVEFHSWGGHSGSPVFYLYPTIVESKIPFTAADGSEIDVNREVNLVWMTGFMGLVSGHYNIEKQAQKTGDILGDIQVALNSGIAIVTPADAVTQLFVREDLVAYRRELRERAESEKPMPTLDVADAQP